MSSLGKHIHCFPGNFLFSYLTSNKYLHEKIELSRLTYYQMLFQYFAYLCFVTIFFDGLNKI